MAKERTPGTPGARKIKRVRVFKTADYQLALSNITKRVLQLKPELLDKDSPNHFQEISGEDYLALPAWQRLLYSYMKSAVDNAKFQQKEIF